MAFIGLTACKTKTTVRVESDENVMERISGLSTYAWLENSTVQGNDRVHNISGLDDLIKAGVNAQLKILGYKAVTLEEADMHLTYHVSLTDLSETHTVGGFESRTSEWKHDPVDFSNMVIEHERGSLLLDVINPENNAVMWRGLVSAILNPDKPKEARQNKAFDSIGKMMEGFPAKR